jgi:hypothetical protein
MIFIGGLGLIGYGVGPSLADASEALARAVMIVSDLLERAALVLLGLFVWRVFGQGRPWRILGLLATESLLVLSGIATLSVQHWPRTPTPPLVEAFGQLAFASPFIWSTVEARFELHRSRRQLALGLCDPMVTNRFLLWALGCGGFSLVTVFSAVHALVPPDGAAAAFLDLLRAGLYVAVAGVVMLGLHPPAIYVRFVASDSEAVRPD